MHASLLCSNPAVVAAAQWTVMHTHKSLLNDNSPLQVTQALPLAETMEVANETQGHGDIVTRHRLSRLLVCWKRMVAKLAAGAEMG